MKRAEWHEEIAGYLYQLEDTLSPDDKLLKASKMLDKFVEMARFYEKNLAAIRDEGVVGQIARQNLVDDNCTKARQVLEQYEKGEI